MTTHLVFVYGSLKRGFHNHSPFLEHAIVIGKATTAAPYLMLDGQAFPYLVNPESLTRRTDLSDIIGRVKGEVYAIGDVTLAELDRLEGHPDFYKRERVQVRMDNKDIAESVPAWVYFLRDFDDAIRRARPVMPDETGMIEWTKAREEAFESATFDLTNETDLDEVGE